MCEKWFDTNKEWQAFDLILTQKLSAGNLADNGYILIGRDEYEYFYKCKNCNQEWKLIEPTDRSKGYFLRKLYKLPWYCKMRRQIENNY